MVVTADGVNLSLDKERGELLPDDYEQIEKVHAVHTQTIQLFINDKVPYLGMEFNVFSYTKAGILT
jgi:hypothetical protein